jgi:hypothetical protein
LIFVSQDSAELGYDSTMNITSLPVNYMHRSLGRFPLFLIPLLLACFALAPQAQAVCQEGCDSSLFNALLGDDALINNTTGAGNTALGWRSLFLDSTGSFNTGVGGGALALNNADSNTAVGAAALLLNTSGIQNTAVGTNALSFNDGGDFNSALGAREIFFRGRPNLRIIERSY